MHRTPPPSAAVEWDFRAPDDPFLDLSGRGLRLEQAPDSRVAWISDPVTGGALGFDGLHDYLRITAAAVGPLDVARDGDAVTVAALVRRESLDTGFIAGMWQEHDDDPRRQYGLFLSLPTYGGAQQVNGHVSAHGGPSDALPYSRDYSATARMIEPGSWRVVAFSYDGQRIRSFLDGVGDERPDFTEVGAPLGAGLSYAKNPYRYPHGLNRGSVSDFTIGGVLLSHGIGNLFAGAIARVGVWAQALDASEQLTLAAAWTPPGRPVINLTPYRPPLPLAREHGGWPEGDWPARILGWAEGHGLVMADGVLLLPAPHTSASFPLPTVDPTEHELHVIVRSGRVRCSWGGSSAVWGPGEHRLRPNAGGISAVHLQGAPEARIERVEVHHR